MRRWPARQRVPNLATLAHATPSPAQLPARLGQFRRLERQVQLALAEVHGARRHVDAQPATRGDHRDARPDRTDHPVNWSSSTSGRTRMTTPSTMGRVAAYPASSQARQEGTGEALTFPQNRISYLPDYDGCNIVWNTIAVSEQSGGTCRLYDRLLRDTGRVTCSVLVLVRTPGSPRCRSRRV